MSALRKYSVRFALGLLVAGAVVAAPSAFARGHVSVGVSVPGLSIGYGGYGRGYGYVSAYPAYYGPAYYAPAYYPAYYDGGYYGPSYYPSASIYYGGYRGGYYRGHDHGYYRGGDYGHGHDYGHHSGYYNRR